MELIRLQANVNCLDTVADPGFLRRRGAHLVLEV